MMRIDCPLAEWTMHPISAPDRRGSADAGGTGSPASDEVDARRDDDPSQPVGDDVEARSRLGSVLDVIEHELAVLCALKTHASTPPSRR